MRRKRVVAAVAVAAWLTACGSDGGDALGPSATVPQATTTTDPYAVPEAIDEAYVNRVLAGLDHAFGEVTRMIVRDRLLTPEAVARLDALYVDRFAQLQIDAFQVELLHGMRSYRETPGDQHTVVKRLITSRDSCVFAEVVRDLSRVVTEPDPRLAIQWVALVPEEEASDPTGLNPTSWVYLYDGFREGFTAPEDPCDEAL